MINYKKDITRIRKFKHTFRIGRIIFCLLFLFFIPYSASSDTLKNDLTLTLGIEIGDEHQDFEDANETVEKGRIVTYRIGVANHGNANHQSLMVLMDTPDYMNYLPNSTRQINHLLPDVEGRSVLAIGHVIEGLGKDQSTYFTLDFQVEKDIPDEEVYTAAWANLMDVYQPLPLMTPLTETRIFGEPKVQIQVIAEALPEAGEQVFEGTQIVYNYSLRNIGGLAAENLIFTPYLPDHTRCISHCKSVELGDLDSGESVFHIMSVEVEPSLKDISEIVNIGYDLETSNLERIENREAIVHFLDASGGGKEGNFVVEINQKPDIILNSADGWPRADSADLTETMYSLSYSGRQKPYTYPTLSSTETYTYPNQNHPCQYTYPFLPGATTYAYNSHKINTCDESEIGCILELESQPIVFSVNTTLPQNAPRLEFVQNKTDYIHPQNTYGVNHYMQQGGLINVSERLTLARAVQNGAVGGVKTEVSATVSEDLWRYERSQDIHHLCQYSCGEDTCTEPIYRYGWSKVSQTLVNLRDTDETPIHVYASTAWLKTEKGHLGTNDHFTSGSQTQANYVNIPSLAQDHLTPSSLYTPPEEHNADYLIFARSPVGEFETAAGENWEIYGTEFEGLSSGIRPEDRAFFHLRRKDLIEKERFGQVKKNELPNFIQGDLNIKDSLIWYQQGDLIIGAPGRDVWILGGQSRIYVEGDVYINGNIFYQETVFDQYNQLTNLRIDADNIYVAGHVGDIEALLLARGTFYSGESKKQLRILGDVIAGEVQWQRQPLLQTSPKEFNQPSEHIIEDMRKYVMPAPGDTQLPTMPIWRQVNVGTGEVTDNF